MAGDRSFEDLCRICITGGGSRDVTVPIYSDEGRSCDLEEKITRFLSIQVSEDDELPKVVCKTCKNKLDSMQNFCFLAVKSQETLLKLRCSDEAEISEDIQWDKEETPWWSFHDGEGESSDELDKSNHNEKGDTNSSSSLLHSILTKGQNPLESDVTEMEVTVDPMLFFEEEDEDGEDTHYDLRLDDNSVSGETAEHVSEPKPYQCYLCPRGFNTDLSLKSHLWNHIPSRRVLATSDLNGSRHEGETTLRTRMFNSGCLCQECGRVYPSKSTLRAHQITHSNLRPHKCSLCDKTFKRNQDLKFHINQHTGERPYRCPYCPKAFASSGNCFSHRKRMHPKQLARDKKRTRR